MALQNTHFGAEQIDAMLQPAKSIFFIGIGGINMSSLAHVTKERGYAVGGSDRTKTALTERLVSEGIAVFYGHDASNLCGYDAVVYTVAVGADNPEYCEAMRRGLPCISRSDYMGYLMRDYTRRVGISGTHGKSTTTSMCAEILMTANADPTVLSGAPLSSMGGAYRVGGHDTMVFEACEYMDSFLDFYPNVAVILNVELDHVDYFADVHQMQRSFCAFAERTGKDGVAVVNGDDPNAVEALTGFGGTVLTFGIDEKDLTFCATNLEERNGCFSFAVLKNGEFFCHVTLNVSGRHNVYNALASLAVADLCGVSGEDAVRGLAAFRGASRRMEYRGALRGARLFDDYAHHPTEVRTTLSGARGMTQGKLFCVFQSHTYSRTHALLDEFADALSLADRVLVTDIYAARERDTHGLTAESFAERIGKHATPVGSFQRAADVLSEELSPGDVAVIMGAGDVYRVFEYLEIEK